MQINTFHVICPVCNTLLTFPADSAIACDCGHIVHTGRCWRTHEVRCPMAADRLEQQKMTAY